ncbi:hypothetical protein ACQ86G_18930 [Roseateles chitinivorans]|uniref:hypothetical protein n=1 Tax=Roseateles chitinivorans TaxID=2917965 RepID=UPI003D67EEC8
MRRGIQPSSFSYDVSGYLTRVTDEVAQTEMTYTTNAQGRILSKDTLTLNKPGAIQSSPKSCHKLKSTFSRKSPLGRMARLA